MQHHKCKLYRADEIFDDLAECWFEIIHEGQIKHAEGEIESTKNLLGEFIAQRSEYDVLLDDGRKGKILITPVGNDPKRASFISSGPLE